MRKHIAIVTIILLVCCAPAGALPWSQKAPLSLNLLNPDRSQDAALRPYMVSLRQRIERQWLPQELNNTRKTKVFLQIHVNGSILQAHIQESSGDQNFDNSTLNAVHESNPFPPPPLTSTRILSIEACFDNRYIDRVQLAENIRRYRLHQEQLQRQQYETQQRSAAAMQETNFPTSLQNPSQEAPYPVNSESAASTEEPQQEISQEAMTEGLQPTPVDISSFRPLTTRQLSSKGPDEVDDYRRQLNEWFLLPPEKRLGQFISTKQPSVRKSSQTKPRKR